MGVGPHVHILVLLVVSLSIVGGVGRDHAESFSLLLTTAGLYHVVRVDKGIVAWVNAQTLHSQTLLISQVELVLPRVAVALLRETGRRKLCVLPLRGVIHSAKRLETLLFVLHLIVVLSFDEG